MGALAGANLFKMKVGVIYNIVGGIGAGKEIDKIAHNEVILTSSAISAVLLKRGHNAEAVRLSDNIFESLKSNFDFIFNLAEDINGDIITESEVAAKLDSLNIPYTGSDAKALEICLHKAKTKEVLEENGIPTPRFQIFGESCKELNLDFPVIVKPLHTDGSLGINMDSVVNDIASLKKKVNEIISLYKQPAIVEEYLDGREINVALIGNRNNIEVLPLSEIIFSYAENIPKIVSYESKWVEDSDFYKQSVGKCPAVLDLKTEKRIIDVAKKTFSVLGCRDYARIDIRLKDDVPYVLEINTKPCLNPSATGTGFIRSAIAAGYDYDSIIFEIFKTAVKRYGIKENLQ